MLATQERAQRAGLLSVIAGFKKLCDAWDGKQTEPSWNYAWPKLIGFFEEVLGDPHCWSEQVAEDGTLSPNRNWIPATISEFLRAGTRSDEKAYAPELMPRTWSLIKILLRDTEVQQEPSAGNALNNAINTSKGKAIEALFNHALRWCRVSDAETKSHTGAWRDMQSVFDEEIGACRNGNFEFSALAGSYITNLQYLDSDWLHNNFRGIFPIDFPANCLSALDGLAFATPTEAIYTELVDTGIVVWALNQELKGGHARENLVQRMCLAYLWNKEDLESPRFAVLFNRSHADDLEIACRYFWAIRGQPLTDEQKEKILLFWDRSVTWAANTEPAPVKLLSALSLLSCYLRSVGPRELSWLLAVAPHISVSYNADFFIEELGRLVEISPVQVGNVLATAIQTHKPLDDYEDRLKTPVIKLAERPETRPDAPRCAEGLRYVPEIVQLYAQLISDPTRRDGRS